MFEDQYTELQEAVDVIPERILALGYPAPASYGEFAGLATVKDEEGVAEAMEMVRRLVDAHEATIHTARAPVETAESAGDVATADLATQRIDIHEKTSWMLRATAS